MESNTIVVSKVLEGLYLIVRHRLFYEVIHRFAMRSPLTIFDAVKIQFFQGRVIRRIVIKKENELQDD